MKQLGRNRDHYLQKKSKIQQIIQVYFTEMTFHKKQKTGKCTNSGPPHKDRGKKCHLDPKKTWY